MTDTPPDTIRFVKGRATNQKLSLEAPLRDGRVSIDEAAELAVELLDEAASDLREGLMGQDVVEKLSDAVGIVAVLNENSWWVHNS